MNAPLNISTATLRICVMIAARAYETADRHSRHGLTSHAAQCMERAVIDIITEYENNKIEEPGTFLGREINQDGELK